MRSHHTDIIDVGSMDAIQVNGLGKRYQIGSRTKRDLWALQNVTFNVPRGTILSASSVPTEPARPRCSSCSRA